MVGKVLPQLWMTSEGATFSLTAAAGMSTKLAAHCQPPPPFASKKSLWSRDTAATVSCFKQGNYQVKLGLSKRELRTPFDSRKLDHDCHPTVQPNKKALREVQHHLPHPFGGFRISFLHEWLCLLSCFCVRGSPYDAPKFSKDRAQGATANVHTKQFRITSTGANW